MLEMDFHQLAFLSLIWGWGAVESVPIVNSVHDPAFSFLVFIQSGN